MAVQIVPPLEQPYWPTLGPDLCDMIEERLVFGPGDMRGLPAVLDDEWRAIVYRLYEVFPYGHPRAGRRRFKRAGLMKRKGTAKTEFAAWIAALELHPDAPVRCDGFRREGGVWIPVGRPVSDPYIPLLAWSEDQVEDVGAYDALKTILELSTDADLFDIGLQRITRADGTGKAQAVATAPDARDAAKTTFQHADETHRLSSDRARKTWRVMLANLPKRVEADAWALETTTGYAPGEGSIAESTQAYADKIDRGQLTDPRLFYFRRYSTVPEEDLETPEGLRSAIIEASGPATWSDVEDIAEQFAEPDADWSYLRRVWLDELIEAQGVAFDAARWKKLLHDPIAILDEAGEPTDQTRPYHPEDGALIALGFDGSLFWDSTAIVACEISTGFTWLLAIWRRPERAREWQVPEEEVNAVIDGAFTTYEVWKVYADPAHWEQTVALWQGKYGHERVEQFWTNQWTKMARAVRNFRGSIDASKITHPAADTDLARTLDEHVGNARRRYLTLRDEDGAPMFVIQKERSDSPNKIDAAVAAVLAWQARTDAAALGLADPTVWTAA